MPKINVHNKTITCEVGANLRQVLLSHQVPVHNGNANIINCRGLGTCGTCAVDIEGKVSSQQWRDGENLIQCFENP